MKAAAVLALPALLLGGCVSTVASVVTAPVRVVSQGVDWATTSQSEADRNRGRKIRKAEEKARALGFASFPVHTVMTACEHDIAYHFEGQDRLAFALDNIIFRMQRAR
jgi:hypothetical protein